MIIKSEINQEEINNNCIDIEIIEHDQRIKKTISIDDYVTAINDMSKRFGIKKTNIDCQDVINISIVNKKDISLTFLIPAFDLFLTHNNKPMIWKLPNIICECSTKGDLKFWCIKTKKYSKKSKLYKLNLPHHYDNGTVCYGSFSTKNIEPSVEKMTDYATSYLQTASTHNLTSNLVPQKDGSFKYIIK